MLNAAQISSCAQFVLDQARHVVETFGKRDPGSPGECATQEYIKTVLQPHVDTEVVIEPFQVAPKAFMGFQFIAGLFILTASVAYWFVPWVALALIVTALFVVVQVLLRYKLLLDPFFPQRTSYNVQGIQKPKGEVKRRIILNGHADAAYEWRYHYMNPKSLKVYVPYVFGGLFFALIANTLFVFFGDGWANGYQGTWLYVGLAQLFFVPGGVAALFYTNFNVVSPGANDNLSGTFTAVGLAKAFREAGVQLENTEIMYLITGSEEAGLRGAKAYAKRHKKELTELPSAFVAIDTIRDLEFLRVYNRDLNGTLKHNEELCSLFMDASKNVGLDLQYGTVTLGSSDATAFTQEGIPSVAICAMDVAPAHYYHNRRDTCEIMDKECIEKCLTMLVEAVNLYDKRGLRSTA